MDETEIKTRQGLILENVCAAALTEAGFAFDQDVQYDETCEKPDFLIPGKIKPKIMVETHQTEARDSFRMKILRAFTAVTESKAYFGNALVSVNVLFGDPDNELPASNVKAMCGIFDVNIIPRRELSNPTSIREMEDFASELAAAEDRQTKLAATEVIKKHHSAVSELATLFTKKLSAAKARTELNDLWNLERTRSKNLGTPPKADSPTYYKRCILWALFLTDQDFAELQREKDPSICSVSTKKQLIATKLVTVTEEIDGDHYTLKPEFVAFLNDPDCVRLRSICKDVLDTVPEMKWFFQDIRDEKRRLREAEVFIAAWRKGLPALRELFIDSFKHGDAGGIAHQRCWVGDLLPLILGKSHNHFNGLVRRHPDYPTSLGNPYNNIVIRSSRLGSDDTLRLKYAEVAWSAFETHPELLKLSSSTFTTQEMADLLFKFRCLAAIKLQKLDPLFLTALGIAGECGCTMGEVTAKSVVGDLAGEATVGDFMTFYFGYQNNAIVAVANVVAVHDNNGDHKSKEWGARRLATLYRMEKGKIRTSEYQESIFVLDGEWKDKDVARLYRSGWNHVVRLADLDVTLRMVFNIKGKPKPSKMEIAPVTEAEEPSDAN
jgi:hypothetical protein